MRHRVPGSLPMKCHPTSITYIEFVHECEMYIYVLSHLTLTSTEGFNLITHNLISITYNHESNLQSLKTSIHFFLQIYFSSNIVPQNNQFISYAGNLWSQASQSVNSITHLCLTLCNFMNCSTPGLPAHHQLLKLAQTRVH